MREEVVGTDPPRYVKERKEDKETDGCQGILSSSVTVLPLTPEEEVGD